MTQPLSKDHPFGTFDDSKRGSRLKAWRPKKWRPEYERMVAMSCLGMSNKMIGQELGYTKEHVSTILNMDEAETIRIMVLEKMRASLLDISIPETLAKIAQKTVKLLNDSFDKSELREKSPFALIDRGLDVVKGLGHLKGGGNGSGGSLTVNVNDGGRAMVITTDQADDLAAAMRRSDEVKKLHSNNGYTPAQEIEIHQPIEVKNGQK